MLRKIRESLNSKYKEAGIYGGLTVIIAFCAALSSFLSKVLNIDLSILSNMFSSIASITGVSALWEIVSKKSFLDELGNILNVKYQLIDSGIEKIVFSNDNDFDWQEEFANAKEITIISCHGDFLADSYKSCFNQVLSCGGNIKYFLPDYGDDLLIQELSRRHNKPNFKSDIIRAETELKKKYENYFTEGQFNIFYYKNTLCTVYYIIQKKDCTFAYFMPYRNSMSQNVAYPKIKVNAKGMIYKRYIEPDINNIMQYSQLTLHYR